MRIGLCLSGGGARGSFHIGVIKALEENKIKPIIVSGTSAGALIGSFYCSGLNSEDMISIANSTKWYHFVVPHIPKTGLIDLKFLDEMLSANIQTNSFESLKLPLITTASNMEAGKIEYFQSGELFSRILASCAVPLVFKPQILNNTSYLDGGIMMNLPVEIIKDKCDFTIASNLFPRQKIDGKSLISFGSIVSRVLDLSIYNNTENQISKADLLIESNEINSYSRFNLSNSKKLIELGYNTAFKAIKESKLI